MTTWMEGTQPDRDDLERVESQVFHTDTGEMSTMTYYKIRGCCLMCGRQLDVEGDLRSMDCGGDCLQCMAESGDPDCAKSLYDAGLPVPAEPLGDPDPMWWRKYTDEGP